MAANIGLIKGFDWLARLLDSAVLNCRLRFDENLLLFRKSLLILNNVVADLAGDGAMDRLLMASCMRQFGSEWLQRWLIPLGSRSLGSRVSNLDLMTASWRLPWLMPTWFAAR